MFSVTFLSCPLKIVIYINVRGLMFSRKNGFQDMAQHLPKVVGPRRVPMKKIIDVDLGEIQ